MTKLKFDAILEDFLSLNKSLLACLRYYLSPKGNYLLTQVDEFIRQISIKRIVFVGHSYNYFASIIPYYYINSKFRSQSSNSHLHNKINCLNYEINDFLFIDLEKYHKETLFIFISKSGESIQIKRVIQKLFAMNINSNQIWGISNHQDSFLAQNSHFYFPIMMGSETVIGTKAYINTILVLYFLSRALMNEPPIPSKIEDEIRQLIFEIKFYGTDWEFHLKSMSEFLGVDYNYLYFISKGASLSTAFLAALNCKSFTRTFGEGINMGLFLHGPFQIVDNSFRCVVIVGDNTSIEDTITLIELITKKLGKGKVVLINNSRELSSLGRANPNVWVFEHTTKNSYLSPIFEIIVLQFLFLDQALRKGVIE